MGFLQVCSVISGPPTSTGTELLEIARIGIRSPPCFSGCLTRSPWGSPGVFRWGPQGKRVPVQYNFFFFLYLAEQSLNTRGNKLSEFNLEDFTNRVNDTSELNSNYFDNVFGSRKFFIKGPIYLSWIGKAARLPGRTLHSALALCFLAGLQNTRMIKMQRKVREVFGISDDVYHSSLKRLESQGLIALIRSPGQTPIVKLLD